MEKLNKTIKNNEKAITLIALVITIIVLLILAGISISMLSGDNSILQKATDAKTNTERANVIELAKTDILGQIAENKGENISKEQLATILNKQFKTVDENSIPDEVSSSNDIKLTTIDEKYKINLSEIFKGKFANEYPVTTFGEKYEDSMIGKTIAYTSNNGENNWIILGKDKFGDILITTKDPVGNYRLNNTAKQWYDYENDLNNSCSIYTGTIGANNIAVKNARSITIEDINYTVGYTATETELVFGTNNTQCYYPNEETDSWVKPTAENEWSYEGISTQYIEWSQSENMTYIAGCGDYLVATKTVYKSGTRTIFEFGAVESGAVNLGMNWMSTYSSGTGFSPSMTVSEYNITKYRPVVVISSDTPWKDIKNLIGEYVTYE